jgi:hypothetical protein
VSIVAGFGFIRIFPLKNKGNGWCFPDGSLRMGSATKVIKCKIIVAAIANVFGTLPGIAPDTTLEDFVPNASATGICKGRIGSGFFLTQHPG